MPRNSKEDADIIRVRHMVDAAAEAISFVRGKKRVALDGDRQLLLALLKDIEIIGEAASRVSSEFQEKYSEIPWYAVVATRNRLVHGYFDIDADIVWSTVTVDLPSLLKVLKKIK